MVLHDRLLEKLLQEMHLLMYITKVFRRAKGAVARVDIAESALESD